jgi:hypothetical protein
LASLYFFPASAVSLLLLEEITKTLYEIETDPLGALALIGSADFGTGVVKLVPVAQVRVKN